MDILAVLLTVSAMTLTIVSGCPQALDWEKLPAEEKATRAPIVVVGYVTKSYKHLADKLTNYAVDFKIIRTVKGAGLIASLPKDAVSDGDVHRITNFGSMHMCFADVNENHVFMLFLHVVDNHLSAHYSDLFGAAEVWTMQMEDKVILANLGKCLFCVHNYILLLYQTN